MDVAAILSQPSIRRRQFGSFDRVSDDRKVYPSVRLLRRFAPCVAMVQATEAGQGSHVCGRRRLPLDCPLVRGIPFQRVVNAVLMVIAHGITHQPEPMSLVQRDDMVQDLSATNANPSFRDSVGKHRRLHRMSAVCINPSE